MSPARLSWPLVARPGRAACTGDLLCVFVRTRHPFCTAQLAERLRGVFLALCSVSCSHYFSILPRLHASPHFIYRTDAEAKRGGISCRFSSSFPDFVNIVGLYRNSSLVPSLALTSCEASSREFSSPSQAP